MRHKPTLVISGGQTGADKAGLVAAYQCGIKTGGYAPSGYRTERGQDLSLASIYGLIEIPSSSYLERTEKNILAADATIIFSTNRSSPGTKATYRSCSKINKPFILLDPDLHDASAVRYLLNLHKPKILNIAGNRESKSPGIFDTVYKILMEVFT